MTSQPPAATDPMEFGPYRLDPVKRVLWREGEVLHVPLKAVDLLIALVEKQGDVVPKPDLLQRVWPDTFVEEANIGVNVSILRRALGSQPGGRPYIETVARRGYRFLGGAQRLSAGSRAPALAVLPLRPAVPGGEEASLGLGIAEALAARLTPGGMMVRPVSAGMRYVDRQPSDAAAGLEVDAVVAGRVEAQGQRLAVTLELVPAGASTPVWSQTFEDSIGNLLALRDSAANQLAATLFPGLGAPSPRVRETRDWEAYRAYVKGRYHWSRLTAGSMAQAFALFREAAERDPTYAQPYAGLAEGCVLLGVGGHLAPAEAWPLARDEARRALDRDATLAEAHVCLAFVGLFGHWDWTFARAELDRAVALAPHDSAARQWRALFLLLENRLVEAGRELAHARANDPLSVVISALTAFHLSVEGRHDLELRECRRAVELDPDHFLGHWSLGLACEHNGLRKDAVSAHRAAVARADGAAFMQAVLARSLALAGDHRAARDALAALEEAGGGCVSSYQRATVHLALGAKERALDLLAAACEERDPWVVLLGIDPMLRPLSTEARFADIVDRVVPRRPSRP